MLGARYDEGRNELFIRDWQQPHAFVPFFENDTVPEQTDMATTGVLPVLTTVKCDWLADTLSVVIVRIDLGDNDPIGGQSLPVPACDITHLLIALA